MMKKEVVVSVLFLMLCFLCHAQSPDIHSGMAEVGEKVLYYEEAGQGPAVVLIHGGQLDRRMWDDQFALFAKDYRVIRYDVRGSGKSRIPAYPYSDVEDLYGLLRSLKIEKAHLIGLSLGGRIAIDFTLTHPEIVLSLIPVAPGLTGFQWSPGSFESWNSILRAAQMGDDAKAAELWLKDPFMAPAMENAAVAEKLRKLSLENSHVWLINPFLQIDPDPPAAKRLAEIHAPTLLIVGDRDISDIQKIVDQLDKDVPKSSKAIIRGAGHMVNMEKPQEFNHLVLRFLEAQNK